MPHHDIVPVTSWWDLCLPLLGLVHVPGIDSPVKTRKEGALLLVLPLQSMNVHDALVQLSGLCLPDNITLNQRSSLF